MKDKYACYRRIKIRLSCEYRQFNLGYLLAGDIEQIVYDHKPPFRLQTICSNLMTALSPCFLDSAVNPLLFSLFTKRRDYELLIENIVKAFTEKRYTILTRCKIRFKFSVIVIIRAILFILRKRLALCWKTNIYLISKTVFYMNSIHIFTAKDLVFPRHLKAYIAFNSSFGTEAFLTQFFKLHALATYSLQHGIYYFFPSPVPREVVNYENMQADYLLCWGQYTVDEMLKFGIDRHRLLLGGHPFYHGTINGIRRSFQSCLFLLSRIKYDRTNNKILEILKELRDKYHIRITVRLHPSLDFNRYAQIAAGFNFEIDTINATVYDCLQSKAYDFSIAYNTSAYYESLAFGLIAFSYQDDSMEKYMTLGDYFRNADELIRMIETYKRMDTGELDKRINDFLNYTIGTNENNYFRLLNPA